MVQEKDNQVLIYSLAFALFIHIGMSLVHFSKPDYSLRESSEQVIKLKLINTKTKQIVETEKGLDKKTDSSFLSEKNNFFERETRSKKVASFKKAQQGSAQQNNVQESDKKKVDLKDLKFSLQKVPLYEQKNTNPAKKSFQGKKKALEVGSSNDFIKDVPLGDFTRLNTQEYEFYGFYHRIRQKLEQFWGMNIQEKAEKLFKSGRSIASDSNLVTSLTIKLDKSGKIIDIKVNSPSGIKELDDAAINSFNQAGPFPNPPSKMLKNGYATIEWGFVVNT